MDSKYDVELEQSIRTWINEQVGITLGADFKGELKSGTVLCKSVHIS
jgi:hypothetical protein